MRTDSKPGRALLLLFSYFYLCDYLCCATYLLTFGHVFYFSIFLCYFDSCYFVALINIGTLGELMRVILRLI